MPTSCTVYAPPLLTSHGYTHRKEIWESDLYYWQISTLLKTKDSTTEEEEETNRR